MNELYILEDCIICKILTNQIYIFFNRNIDEIIRTLVQKKSKINLITIRLSI